MNSAELKDFLNHKAAIYENSRFIETDPIQIPHRFTTKEDIEISAFLLSTIAWGNRTMIIKNGEKLMQIMGNNPFDYIQNYQPTTHQFVHRTFNAVDLDFYFRSLQAIYQNGGLEKTFTPHPTLEGIKGRIVNFRTQFLSVDHEKRSEKHLSNPLKNSACKRLNMFLRWMVRDAKKGVDFGIWKSISPAELMIPLDVHTSRQARALQLIQRTKDDWQALEELMDNLRNFDPNDPAKYDFALFGLGVFEGF